MAVSYVKIHYGPYESFYTVSHKPQKLEGLKCQLQKIGYRVRLFPVQYLNYCILEMCGHEVFRCNIKNLQFNVPAEEDPVCQRAVKAVVEATSKLIRARNYLWAWTLIDQQIFLGNKFPSKPYLPLKLDSDITLDCICDDTVENDIQ